MAAVDLALTHAAFDPGAIGHREAEAPVVNDSQPGDVTAVLVHGGFLGPWIWADTVRLLSEHSYAGLVVSEAAAGPHKAARHLVFLAAAIPDLGDSLTSLAEAGSREV